MRVYKRRDESTALAVVGLGKAGLPLAAVIAEAGLSVVGIDTDSKRCTQVNKGKNPIPEEPLLDELIKKHGGKTLVASSCYEDAKGCMGYIIIVPLLIDDHHNADFTMLEDAFRNVGKILKRGDCVILETTVPPLTTETKIQTWLEEESGLQLGEFYLAHSPERIMTGYSISRLHEFPKVIGGVDKKSGKKAFNIYKKFIPQITIVSSARVAEFIKVIEGCYRFTNISLANELFKISEVLQVDFDEARKYANHQFCDIHYASTGSGGHCIPVYPWFLINEMQKRNKPTYTHLLCAAHTVNEDMTDFWAKKIILKCKSIKKPLYTVKICVKGITFRKGVKSLYYSRNLALLNCLQKKGLNVYVFDELLSKKEINAMGLRFITPERADIVFNSFSLEITE